MTDKITLTQLSSLENETTAINQINGNSVTIVAGFDNTLSRDGTSPNQMGANLDMNSFQILNLPSPGTVNSPARLVDVSTNPTITVPPTGTSGSTVPFLNGNNTWSGTNNYTAATTFSAIGNSTLTGTLSGGTITGTIPFTQTGTSATLRNVTSKLGEVISVKDFGAVGDGTTDDTTAIQNTINAVIAAGGGTVFFPAASVAYKTTTQIIVDLSAISTRYQGRIHLLGTNPSRSVISNTTLAGNILFIKGDSANPEGYCTVENLRLTGSKVVGSVGLQLSGGLAYLTLKNVYIEAFDYGIQATDVEQIGLYDTNVKFCNQGMLINAAGSTTDPNSWTFVNCAIANNTVYGIQATHANAFVFLGGSIQYNGTIAGSGSAQWGIKLIDCGTGYGTVLFSGLIFEGNGGAGDFVSTQSANKCNITFDTVSFSRTNPGGGVGYGTNQISVSGSGNNANYKITNSNFYGYGTYSASGSRPAIVNTSTGGARISIDGLTTFWSTTESPTNGGGITINSQVIPARLLLVLRGVNFNSANTDNPITVSLPTGTSNYSLNFVRIANASASISTATYGLYTAASAGGTGILTATAITVTSASANTNNNSMQTSIGSGTTQSFNVTTLYFRIGTAQGTAATADVFIELIPY